VIVVRLVAAIALAGCNAILGVHGVTVGGNCDGSLDDAAVDGSLAMGDTTGCVGKLARYCFTGLELDVVIESTVLDTTSANAPCDPTSPSICIIAGRNVKITGSVSVVGARPLALFASEGVSVAGMALLDVGSHAMTSGPGANDQACASIDDLVAAAGTAGGTFGGQGGDGGASGGANPPASPPGPQPDHVRGGCAGGRPSNASGASSGGGVYIYSETTIVISGAIDAGGAGGAGGSLNDGGGGGGAGGLIALDAPTIQLDTFAALRACGGGGGAGGGMLNKGAPGHDGGSDSAGGAGNGADGGIGGCQVPAAAGAQGGSLTGGGGGGGGAGFILTSAPITGTAIEPPAKQL